MTPRLLLPAAALLTLAACSDSSPGAAPAPSTAPPPAATVGAPGSACELPVTLGLAESWKPKAVELAADDPLAELARRGPLTMACEIDAKPAGNIGFLRVWTGAGQDPRAALQAFLGTDAVSPAFTDVTIGGKPAVEVVYQSRSRLDDELEKERAFAVPTAEGLVAVVLDSFDDVEHEQMIPAYELAKSTLTVTG
ncbi:lipoprotein [Actinoplanes sp. RD1]|uniref:lipoprotein n=1 Tax=Actinoplanes sp. RD1 TaxID=3064538 RepID=UPI0027405267|nr:lipoprotein [Actinoplanes sp. RD1]